MLAHQDCSVVPAESEYDHLARWLEREADQQERAAIHAADPHGARLSGEFADNLRLAASMVRDLAARVPEVSAISAT